jgi:hypothetical protein
MMTVSLTLPYAWLHHVGELLPTTVNTSKSTVSFLKQFTWISQKCVRHKRIFSQHNNNWEIGEEISVYLITSCHFFSPCSSKILFCLSLFLTCQYSIKPSTASNTTLQGWHDSHQSISCAATGQSATYARDSLHAWICFTVLEWV